jgi:hypothetical protein
MSERNFDVFVDEEREENGDVLRRELTRPSQRRVWSVPVEGFYF